MYQLKGDRSRKARAFRTGEQHRFTDLPPWAQALSKGGFGLGFQEFGRIRRDPHGAINGTVFVPDQPAMITLCGTPVIRGSWVVWFNLSVQAYTDREFRDLFEEVPDA